MKRKLLTIVMSTIILGTVLAGCGNTNTSITNSNKATKTKVETKKEIKNTKKEDEKKDIIKNLNNIFDANKVLATGHGKDVNDTKHACLAVSFTTPRVMESGKIKADNITIKLVYGEKEEILNLKIDGDKLIDKDGVDTFRYDVNKDFEIKSAKASIIDYK